MERRKISIFEGPVDADGVQVHSGQNALGQEMPDPVPMSLPVGYEKSPTLQDMVKRMVQHQLLAVAADQEGFDTFDEAEDFTIEDDPIDPQTPYEAVFNPPKAAEKAGEAGGSPDTPPAPAAEPVASPEAPKPPQKEV